MNQNLQAAVNDLTEAMTALTMERDQSLAREVAGQAKFAEVIGELAQVRQELGETRIEVAQAEAERKTAQAKALKAATDLAEAKADLRVAAAENEGLWQVVNRYHAMWAKDVAVEQRGRAEAELARGNLGSGDDD
jgi:chromosome segregation ATPase